MRNVMTGLQCVVVILLLSYVASAGASHGRYDQHTDNTEAIVGPIHSGCTYYDLSDQCRKTVDHWYQQQEPVYMYEVWDNHLKLPAITMVELMAKFERGDSSAEELKALAVEHLARQRQYPVSVYNSGKKVAQVSNTQLIIGYIILALGCTVILITVEAALRQESRRAEKDQKINFL